MTVKKIETRDYQKAAISRCLNYWGQGNREFRYSMCTGAGKTVTSILTVLEAMEKQKIAKTKHIIVVATHVTNLKAQFKEKIEDLLKTYGLGKGVEWVVECRQTLQSKTLKDDLFMDRKVFALIIDESHQGGLDKDGGGEYSKIVKALNPKHILGLSATDVNLDPKIFGMKTAQNSFDYGFSQGIVDGYINDCNLVTIHTGLEQTVEDTETTKKSKIKGDDLEHLYAQDVEKAVDLRNEKSAKAIELANLNIAIAVYLDQEVDWEKRIMPQAVFFVATCDLADEAVDIFMTKFDLACSNHNIKNFFPRAVSANDIVRAVHSRMERKTVKGVRKKKGAPVLSEDMDTKDLKDFKDGLFPVIFNVRQLQEGFDYPKLEIAFDCCLSVTNGARILTQRLGRILRREEGKKPSRYYVCVSLVRTTKNFDASKDSGLSTVAALPDSVIDLSKNPDLATLISESSDPEAIVAHVNIEAQAVIGGNGLNNDTVNKENINGMEIPADIVVSKPALQAYFEKQMPPSVTLVKSGLFVRKAEGHKKVSTILLSQIFKGEKEAHWSDNLGDDSDEWVKAMKTNLKLKEMV